MKLKGFKDKQKVLISDRGEWFKAEYREDTTCKTLVLVFMLEGLYQGGEIFVHPGRVKRAGKKKAK